MKRLSCFKLQLETLVIETHNYVLSEIVEPIFLLPMSRDLRFYELLRS